MKPKYLIILLAILVGGAVCVVLRALPISRAPLPSRPTPTPAMTQIEKLRVWNNFVRLPVLKDCQITYYDTCTSLATYTKDVSGKEQLVISQGSGIIETKMLQTIRAIMLGDSNQNYAKILAALSGNTSTSEGNKRLFVEDIVDESFHQGLNPLLTSEIEKILLQDDLKQLGMADDVDPTQLTNVYVKIFNSYGAVTKDLASYRSLFLLPAASVLHSAQFASLGDAQGAASRLLGNDTYTPMQKAVIFYFYQHSNFASYSQFIGQFVSHTSLSVGSYPIVRATSVSPSHVSFYFCADHQPALCVLSGSVYTCSKTTQDRLCIANYVLE